MKMLMRYTPILISFLLFWDEYEDDFYTRGEYEEPLLILHSFICHGAFIPTLTPDLSLSWGVL